MRSHFTPCTPRYLAPIRPLQLARRHGSPARRLGLLFALPFALAAALAGCSSTFQWVKDGFGTSHADAQFAACQLEAERLLYSSAESAEDRATRIDHESRLCMQADGWRWAESDGQGSFAQLGTSAGGAADAQTAKRTRAMGSAQVSETASAKSPETSNDEAEDKKDARSSKPTDDDADDEDDEDDDDEDSEK